jgi:hypothetical protein
VIGAGSSVVAAEKTDREVISAEGSSITEVDHNTCPSPNQQRIELTKQIFMQASAPISTTPRKPAWQTIDCLHFGDYGSYTWRWLMASILLPSKARHSSLARSRLMENAISDQNFRSRLWYIPGRLRRSPLLQLQCRLDATADRRSNGSNTQSCLYS